MTDPLKQTNSFENAIPRPTFRRIKGQENKKKLFHNQNKSIFQKLKDIKMRNRRNFIKQTIQSKVDDEERNSESEQCFHHDNLQYDHDSKKNCNYDSKECCFQNSEQSYNQWNDQDSKQCSLHYCKQCNFHTKNQYGDKKRKQLSDHNYGESCKQGRDQDTEQSCDDNIDQSCDDDSVKSCDVNSEASCDHDSDECCDKCCSEYSSSESSCSQCSLCESEEVHLVSIRDPLCFTVKGHYYNDNNKPVVAKILLASQDFKGEIKHLDNLPISIKRDEEMEGFQAKYWPTVVGMHEWVHIS